MENKFCGGKAFRLVDLTDNTQSVILCREEKNTLFILEAGIEISKLKENIGLILDYTDTKEAYIQNKGGMLWLPEDISGIEDKGYLRLTLE